MQPREHGEPGEWLEATGVIGQLELAQICGIGTTDIDELVDYGVLVAEGPAGGPRVFSSEWVQPLREACGLWRVYDLDLFAAGLLLVQLHRIRKLERQLHELDAHLPYPARAGREGPGGWREAHAKSQA